MTKKEIDGNMVEKCEIFTKERSRIVYGVAICLMVFHHLFAFPGRISSTYKIVFDFSTLYIETILAYFGRICVCIFAFMSGYGMAKKKQTIKKGYELSIIQMKKFYMCYWIVFVLFVPYGLYKGILRLHIKEIIKNAIGFSCSYNLEWWYVKEYLIMLFVFPSIYKVIEYINRKMQFCFKVVIEILILNLINFLNRDSQCIVMFAIGIIFAKENVFDFFYKKVNGNGCSFLLLCMTIITRTLLGEKADVVITPIFVYAIYIFSEKKIIGKCMASVLKKIGKYSTYIWLTHTFFIYYYFQNIIFAPRYSILVFIWTMVLCMCVGWGLEKILSIIQENFGVLKRLM